MSGNDLVLSLSMTRLQASLVCNALSDSISRHRLMLERFAPGTLEHGDFRRHLAELRDLYSSFIHLQLGTCTHTLAALSVSDDLPVHLEALDHE